MGDDDDSDIDDITLEPTGDVNDAAFGTIIRGAKERIEGALEALIRNPRTKRLLKEESARAEQKFRGKFSRDRSDIEEHLLTQLRDKIHQLKNPTPGGLRFWLRAIARNFCLNGGRHENIVARHDGECVAESVRYAMHGGTTVVHFAAVKTPEAQLETKEQLLAVRRKLLNLIDTFPQERREFAQLWAEESPKEIINETGRPASTVYRELRALQRMIVAEVGIAGDIDADLIDELRSWVADILESRPKVA